jgi:NADPH-dependent 2,4-dienoyl-CoA reductase/sulfur reductase-like enzyme
LDNRADAGVSMQETDHEWQWRSSFLWMATADPPVFAPLTADAHGRVCIVGAGIAGLTTAYRLAKPAWT